MRKWVTGLTAAVVVISLFAVSSTIVLYNELQQVKRALLTGNASGSLGLPLPAQPDPGRVPTIQTLSGQAVEMHLDGKRLWISVIVQAATPVDLLAANPPYLVDMGNLAYVTDNGSMTRVRQAMLDLAQGAPVRIELSFDIPKNQPGLLVFNANSTKAAAPELQVDLRQLVLSPTAVPTKKR
jgi:hypothetical protein